MATEVMTAPEGRIIHKTYAVLSGAAIPQRVHVTQYDESLPVIACTLYKDGQLYTIPDGASVRLRMNKNGLPVYHEAMGIDDARHVVYLEITAQMTVLYGEFAMVIEVETSDGKTAGTSYLRLIVRQNPVQNPDLDNIPDYTANSNKLTAEGVKKLQDESSTQQKAIEDKAKKTLESIPADYSALSGKVDENTSGISELKEELIAYEIDEKDTKCGCKPEDENSINSEYLFHIKANSIYQIYVTVNSGTYNGSGTFGIRNVFTEGKFGDGEFGKKTHALTVVPQTNMYAYLFVYFHDPIDTSTIDVTFTILEIEKSALYGQRRIETAKYENLQLVEYGSGLIAKTGWLFTAKDHYYMLSWKLKKGRIPYKGTFGIVDGEEAKFDNRATEGKAVFKAPKTDNHKFFVYIHGHGSQTVDIEIKDVTGLENLFPIADNVLSLRETNSPFSIYENIEMAVKKDSVTALLSSTGKKVGINPVLNKDFPDPSVIKIGDFYYAFGTGTPCYIYISPDLIHWSLYSSVFPADFNYEAIFGNDFVNMWANDINIIDGKLVDFIGVDYGSDEKKRKLIAMVAESIDSAFSYAGVVIDSYYNSQNLNPIDAEYTEANGNSYIIAGSYNGIYIYSYDKNTMKYDGKTKKKIVKEGSNEGSYIYKNGNYYYLFTSNGNYENYTYKICISRSENIEGPYLNKNGDDVTVEDPTPILYSLQNHPLYGPGHNGEIFVDADNRYYMPMHCHIDGAPSNERHMILMQLKFDSDGWPFFVDHNGDKTENPDVYVLFPKIN